MKNAGIPVLDGTEFFVPVASCGRLIKTVMDIRFYIDPETQLSHIYRHDVDEDEDVLYNIGEDRQGREGSWIAVGQTSEGRYLRVVYVPDPEPDRVFVITAYELRGRALTAYKRRHKKGGKL